MPQSEINQLVLSVLEKEVREKQYLDPKDMIVTSEVLADESEIKFFNGALFHKEGNSWIQDRNKLLRISFPHKVFFMVGKTGANGKSTFFEMLNSWVGDLGLNLALEQFNDQISVMELEGKLVNVGDDIDSGYMEKSMNFKTLASGNTIMV